MRIAISLLPFLMISGCGSGQSQSEAVSGWVIGKGGQLIVSGKSLPVKKIGDIPPSVQIEQISLAKCQVSDEDVENLAVLKDLQKLILFSTQVGDAGVEHLLKIENLKELELSGTEITDAGLLKLAELKKLEKLQIHNTKVTSKAIKELGNLLPGCTITK